MTFLAFSLELHAEWSAIGEEDSSPVKHWSGSEQHDPGYATDVNFSNLNGKAHRVGEKFGTLEQFVLKEMKRFNHSKRNEPTLGSCSLVYCNSIISLFINSFSYKRK